MAGPFYTGNYEMDLLSPVNPSAPPPGNLLALASKPKINPTSIPPPPAANTDVPYKPVEFGDILGGVKQSIQTPMQPKVPVQQQQQQPASQQLYGETRKIDRKMAASQAKIDKEVQNQVKLQEQINLENERAANEIANVKKAELAAADEYLQERQAHHTQAAEETNLQQQGLDDKMRQVDEFKIEPGGVWAKGNNWQKAGAGIAIALGAMGAAFLKSGRNPALEILQKAAEDDVKLQMQERQRLREQAEGAKEKLQMTQDRHAQQQVEMNEELALRYKSLAKQMESITANLDSATQKEQGALTIAALNQKAEEAKMNAYNVRFDNNLRGITAAGQMQGREDANMLEAMKLSQESKDKGAKDIEATLLNNITQAKAALDAARNLGRSYEENIAKNPVYAGAAMLNRYNPLLPKALGQYAYGGDVYRFEDERIQDIQTVGRYAEGGVLREADFKRYNEVMAPQVTDSTERVRNKVSQLERKIFARLRDEIEGAKAAGRDTSKVEEWMKKEYKDLYLKYTQFKKDETPKEANE